MTAPSHRVLAAYHQVHLAPADTSPVSDHALEPALAQVADGGRSLVLFTRIAMGPVTVRVDEGPGPAADDGWEEREVLQMDVDEPLFLGAPTLDDAGPFEPVYRPRTAGRRTVTVLGLGHQHDRYDDVVLPDEDPFEEYLVLIQPG